MMGRTTCLKNRQSCSWIAVEQELFSAVTNVITSATTLPRTDRADIGEIVMSYETVQASYSYWTSLHAIVGCISDASNGHWATKAPHVYAQDGASNMRHIAFASLFTSLEWLRTTRTCCRLEQEAQ